MYSYDDIIGPCHTLPTEAQLSKEAMGLRGHWVSRFQDVWPILYNPASVAIDWQTAETNAKVCITSLSPTVM